MVVVWMLVGLFFCIKHCETNYEKIAMPGYHKTSCKHAKKRTPGKHSYGIY